MRTAIYVRVSTTLQTVEQQEQPLKEYCKLQGYEFDIFRDIGVSGAKESRPELDKMLQGIRTNLYTAVLIYKLDRLGRSLAHLLQLIEEFHNRKVKFICLNPVIDTDTAQGRFFLQVMGAVGELEREMMRDRIKDKLALKKQDIEKQGYFKTREGKKITALGRPKGSKDKTKRKRWGYFKRFKKTTLAKTV